MSAPGVTIVLLHPREIPRSFAPAPRPSPNSGCLAEPGRAGPSRDTAPQPEPHRRQLHSAVAALGGAGGVAALVQRFPEDLLGQRGLAAHGDARHPPELGVGLRLPPDGVGAAVADGDVPRAPPARPERRAGHRRSIATPSRAPRSAPLPAPPPTFGRVGRCGAAGSGRTTSRPRYRPHGGGPPRTHAHHARGG